MLTAIVIVLTAVAVHGQRLPVRDYRDPYYNESPKPYSFNYAAPLEDGGQSSRTETGDGTGRVQGSYTLTNDEGHTRVVDYVADHDGFRATIRTNEPGTDNQNPADVIMQSSADPAYQYRPTFRRPLVEAIAPVEPAVIPERPYRRPGVVNRYRPGRYN